MSTSCTDSDHPYYKELETKNEKERYKFFTEDKAKRMKFVSLGEVLDFISNGGLNCVGYCHGNKEMVNFIKEWIDAQKPRIDWERVPLSKNSYTYKETGREYFYLWNKPHQQVKSGLPKLPRINYESCPIHNNHEGFVLDRGGRLRCSYQVNEGLKPSFTEFYLTTGLGTGMKKIEFSENGPDEPVCYDEEDNDITDENSLEYKEYLAQLEKFDNEEPMIVTDTCYAIIKEPKNFYLTLENVLERLNCSHDNSYTIHPFSGFTLADYVQAWWQQPGKKKYLKDNENSIEVYKEFKDFVPIGSDD